MAARPSRLHYRALFYVAALLWLPVGIVATAAVRFGSGAYGPEGWPTAIVMAASSLIVPAVCGLPLAFACRRLGRLGHRRAAWMAGVVLGAATVAASLPAGLFGPPGIAVIALLLSLPVWIAAFWLGRRAQAGTDAPPPALDGRDRRP